MNKRTARYLALMDAAMEVEAATVMIEQRHPDLKESEREKLERAYDALARQLRDRAAKMNPNPA